MFDDGAGDGVGLLGVGQVRGVRNIQQPTFFHPVRDLLQHCRRGGRVVDPGDRQGRRDDRRELVAKGASGFTIGFTTNVSVEMATLCPFTSTTAASPSCASTSFAK